MTAVPLLICGCQSYSTPRIQPVAVQRLPVLAAARFTEEYAPDLPRRMLNELSESPTPVTKD